MLLSALPVGWGMAWGCHYQLHSADGLKTNPLRSGILRSLDLLFCFFFSKVPLEFSLNLFFLLFWIYKPRQISCNKTLLPTLCLSFLCFRGPVWTVISHHDLFSHHIHGNRPQMEQSIAASCSCKSSQGNPAHGGITAACTACSSWEFGTLRCIPPAPPA